MTSFSVIGLCILICIVASPKQGLAAEDDRRAHEAYMLGEIDAKAHLEKFFEYANLEKERKRKAGEPPSTSEQFKEATQGVKFLVYNRAVINGICAAAAFAVNDNARMATLTKCIDSRTAAMEKFIKLTDYQSIIDPKSRARCELQGRDFESERHFPPYEFLKDGLGPPVYDFETVNRCILSR